MRNFRIQVTSALGGIIAFIILAIALLDFLAFRNESVELNKELILEKNNALEAVITQKFLGYRNVLESLNIKGHVPGEDELSPENRSSLEDVYNVLKQKVNGVYLFDIEGAVYKSKGAKENANYKNRSYYKALFEDGQKFFVSPPYENSSNGKKSLAIAYKVNDTVAISATIHLDYIIGHIEKRTDLYLYDDKGKIIFSPDPSLFIKLIKEVRPDFAKLNKENPEFSYRSTYYGESNNGESKNVRAFWGKIALSGWQYVTIIDSQKITQSAQKQLIYSLLLGLVCFLIASVILLYVLDRLVLKPVGGGPGEIARLVHNMASGEIDLRLDKKSTDTGIYRSVINFSAQLTELVKNSHTLSDSVSSAVEQLNAVMNDTLRNMEKEMMKIVYLGIE